MDTGPSSGLRPASAVYVEWAQLVEREQRYPLITFEPKTTHIVIYDRFEDGTVQERYDIPISELREAKGVAFWLRQLAQKTWITTRHLELFAQEVYALNGG